MSQPTMNESQRKRFVKHPARACFDAYGHQLNWEDAIAFKERSDGLYIVVLFPYDDHHIVCDIAGDGEGNWEIQNDGDDMTLEDWDKLRIVPGCDWYEVK